MSPSIRVDVSLKSRVLGSARLPWRSLTETRPPRNQNVGMNCWALQTMFVVAILVGCGTTKLAGTSGADQRLQSDALQYITMLESLDPCGRSRVVNTEIAEPPNVPGGDPWTEKWTVDRCGESVYYRVRFTPSPRGGTEVSVRQWKE